MSIEYIDANRKLEVSCNGHCLGFITYDSETRWTFKYPDGEVALKEYRLCGALKDAIERTIEEGEYYAQ